MLQRLSRGYFITLFQIVNFSFFSVALPIWLLTEPELMYLYQCSEQGIISPRWKVKGPYRRYTYNHIMLENFQKKKYKLEFTKTSYRLSLQAHRPMSGIPYAFNVFFWKCTSRAKKVNFISNEFNSGTDNSANLIYRRSLCSYISVPHFSFLLFKHMSTG